MKIRTLVWPLVSLALAATPAVAQERRVDLFDREGNRQGYVIVEPRTGRVDIYDKLSNRTGYGYIRPAGRVETFDLEGNRREQGRWRDGKDRQRD